MNTLNKTDLSMPMEKAGVYSLLFAVPIAMALALVYIYRWGTTRFAAGFDDLFANFFIFLIVFFLGIVVHELIHGFTWMLFGRLPFSAIKFGFQARTFTPYAHCLVPLKVNPYRIGAAMPCILLGLLPAIASLLNGNGLLLAFGLLFTTAAGGDLLILWLIRKVESDKLVEDHPTNAGCYVIESGTETL
ncbi:MAG: DUF3267 domain-containing protein [Chloroflexota bacterium]